MKGQNFTHMTDNQAYLFSLHFLLEKFPSHLQFNTWFTTCTILHIKTCARRSRKENFLWFWWKQHSVDNKNAGKDTRLNQIIKYLFGLNFYRLYRSLNICALARGTFLSHSNSLRFFSHRCAPEAETTVEKL